MRIYIYHQSQYSPSLLPPDKYGVAIYNFEPFTKDPYTFSTLGCLDNAISAVSRYIVVGVRKMKGTYTGAIHVYPQLINLISFKQIEVYHFDGNPRFVWSIDSVIHNSR